MIILKIALNTKTSSKNPALLESNNYTCSCACLTKSLFYSIDLQINYFGKNKLPGTSSVVSDAPSLGLVLLMFLYLSNMSSAA